MLARYYWDKEGAFIASDDSEFTEGFKELVELYGFPDRIRVGPRVGVSQDFGPMSLPVERDDSKCDDCGRPHNEHSEPCEPSA